MKREELPVDKEIEQWKEFVAKNNLKSIDIPYSFSVAAITVTGVMYLRDPFEDSSTRGVVVGAVDGEYNLDRNNQEAKCYDPTGNLLRLVVVFDVPAKELKARFDTRRWDGHWDEGDWAIIWRG